MLTLGRVGLAWCRAQFGTRDPSPVSMGKIIGIRLFGWLTLKEPEHFPKKVETRKQPTGQVVHQPLFINVLFFPSESDNSPLNPGTPP